MNSQEIETKLRKASSAYYADGDSVLSDAEFDQLKDELTRLDPTNEFLKMVGSPIGSTPLAKRKHRMRMGSLHKVTTIEEFNSWLKTAQKTTGENPEVIVQWKLDGSSIELIYQKGKFIQAITRGDGIEGEDVTHSMLKASGLPKEIPGNPDCSVRVEAYIALADWQEHLAEGQKNARNTAAGMVRRTDTSQAHFLRLQAYDIIIKDFQFETEYQKMEILDAFGFTTVESIVCKADGVAVVVTDMEKEKRPTIEFAADGAVIKLNKIAFQEEMGEHDDRPYWARAWKFESESGVTKLIDVVWSMGSHGTIHPTAVLAPVEVAGVTIQNASLHNLDFIAKVGVQIGDMVEVERSGDVIPYIVRVTEKGKERKYPQILNCPACGKPVIKKGPHLACSEPDICPGVQNKKLATYISKRGIMHLGDANQFLLLKSGVVKTIPDLYRLTEEKMRSAGVGAVMGKKILAEIEKSRTTTIDQMIGSLAIDLLGRSEAKNIVKFGIDDIDKWEKLTPHDLMAFEGFKKTKATRITNSLRENWPLIKEMATVIKIVKEEPKASVGTGTLSGVSVCFTGTMERPRKELEKLASDAGAAVHSSVTGGLTYLVMADPTSASTKAQKARKLGTKTISEQDFLRLIGKA